MAQTLLIGKDRYVAIDGDDGAPTLVSQADHFKVGVEGTIDNKVRVKIVALFDDPDKMAVVKRVGEAKRSPYRVVDFDDLRPL